MSEKPDTKKKSLISSKTGDNLPQDPTLKKKEPLLDPQIDQEAQELDQPETYHVTVMKHELVDALNLKPGGVYLDATLGGGGHTREILTREPKCSVIAFDWDRDAVTRAREQLEPEFGDRITVIQSNFALIYRALTRRKIEKIDGIIADFGTSQHQIFSKDGFSFQNRTRLDMRMSKGDHYFTAEYIVNKYSLDHLTKIFSELGQERHARAIAYAIVTDRVTEKFEYTDQLADLIKRVVPYNPKLRHKIHPATRVFQALRIFVNKELENIEKFLRDAVPFLSPGGSIACISFHSLEDRIVKRAFRDNTSLEVVTKKPLLPTDEEIEQNKPSRSAKLRIARKNQH